ncbi:MAG: ABC transporter permease [Planctomycetes bacterium]|jgi:oligopeptide transport system permease protein|nr:ABC transporter permease [Planctomycetota bacterium]MBT4028326.1 ABC transporter permease [Planctomycetota bacterium]MBT4560881.1 ABC transporter permease [Planctomycetota bacterium]MBT5100967.1 ABC transporter permease [Planctomycetota bacterium]MBT5120428.1 ABC transporter permease [Planctomycetota bacterium]
MTRPKSSPFLRRLGAFLLTLLVVHAASFFLLHAARGGPFDAERQLSPEVEQALLAQYHLDEPVHQQYLRALQDLVFHFDLGPSLRYRGTDVSTLLAQSAPVSLALGASALVIALVFGIPLGLWAALRRNQWPDRGLGILTSIFLALPNFVLAGLAISLFSFSLGLLPPAGASSALHYILPAFCLGLPCAAQLARLTRTTTLETLHCPAVQAARARGVHGLPLLSRHVLQRALIPVLAFLGPAAAGILTGSLVLEQVFALPGMGAHFVQAALNRDYTLALGATLLYTAVLGLTTLLADWGISRFDPRAEALS